MYTYPCPHQYCRCHMEFASTDRQHCSNILNARDVDSQCRCDRQGVFCGSCKGDRGFSALLNRCVQCTNISVLILVALVVADTVVYVALVLVSVQFPAWLYPCLFYVQILPYIGEHFPRTFEHAYYPLYYITSASSFYLVYDFCLLKGLSPLLAYFFRYIPLFLALVICPLILLITKRFKKKRGQWHGMWWLVTLMYPHIVYTSMSIINCPTVQVDTAIKSLRWYVCGDVECFKGAHLSLALFAIVVLLICFLAIPFTALIATTKVRICQNTFSRLSKPLLGSFRSKFKWWYSVELARRFITILFIVAFPANNYPTTVVISLLIVITGLIWPYTDVLSNLLDIALSVDVLVLLLIRNTKQANEDLGATSFKVLNGSESDSCVDIDLDLSTLSYILLPFYYIPLLLTLVTFFVWIAKLIRSQIQAKNSTTTVTDRDDQFYGSDVFAIDDRQRGFTRSEINLDLLNSDDAVLVSHFTKLN